MLDQTTTPEKSPNLLGMARCEPCNVRMTLARGEYSCPNRTNAGCPTPAVSADALLRAVMTPLVERMTTDETVERVSEVIQETMQPQGETQRAKLAEAESGFETVKTNLERITALAEEGIGERFYFEAAGEIDEINSAVTELERESRTARDQLDQIDFVRDPAGIRETAGDLRTYLDNPDPEYVQALLDLLVPEVWVTNAGALVVYTGPVPAQEDAHGVLVDRIQIG